MRNAEYDARQIWQCRSHSARCMRLLQLLRILHGPQGLHHCTRCGAGFPRRVTPAGAAGLHCLVPGNSSQLCGWSCPGECWGRQWAHAQRKHFATTSVLTQGERLSLHWRGAVGQRLHRLYCMEGALYKLQSGALPLRLDGGSSSAGESIDTPDQRMTRDLAVAASTLAQLVAGTFDNPYAASGTLVSLGFSLADVAQLYPAGIGLSCAWAAVCALVMSVLAGWVGRRTDAASSSTGLVRAAYAKVAAFATEVGLVRGGDATQELLTHTLKGNVAQRLRLYGAQCVQGAWFGLQGSAPILVALALVGFLRAEGVLDGSGMPAPAGNATATGAVSASSADPPAAAGVTVEVVGTAAAAAMTLLYALSTIPGILDSFGTLAGRLVRVVELHTALTASPSCKPPQVQPPTDACAPLLSVNDLSLPAARSPPSDRVQALNGSEYAALPQREAVEGAMLVQGVTFTLARGEWVLLRGPTGCGKSSLIRGIFGLQPTRGPRPILSTPLSHVHIVPQSPSFPLHATLRHAATFPADEGVRAPQGLPACATGAAPPCACVSGPSSAPSEPPCPYADVDIGYLMWHLRLDSLVGPCLRPVGARVAPSSQELRLSPRLAEWADRMDPASRGTQEYLQRVNLPVLTARLNQVADWGARLSPGEAQRLAILRLLLHAPALAVLDEATSAMDEATEGVALGAVRGLGCGVLSVGHRSSLVGWHGRVLELTPLGIQAPAEQCGSQPVPAESQHPVDAESQPRDSCGRLPDTPPGAEKEPPASAALDWLLLTRLAALFRMGFPRLVDWQSALLLCSIGVSISLTWLSVSSVLKTAALYEAIVQERWGPFGSQLAWAGAVYVGAAVAGAVARLLGKCVAVLWYYRLVRSLTHRLLEAPSTLPSITAGLQRHRSTMQVTPSLSSLQAASGRTPLILPAASPDSGVDLALAGDGCSIDQRVLADAYAATHQVSLVLFGAENRIALLTVVAQLATLSAAAARVSAWATGWAWVVAGVAACCTLLAAQRIPRWVYALQRQEGLLRQQHTHAGRAAASIALEGGGPALRRQLDTALGRVLRAGHAVILAKVPAVLLERCVALGGTAAAYWLASAALGRGDVPLSHGSTVSGLYTLAGLLTSLLLYACALPDYITLTAGAAGMVHRVSEVVEACPAEGGCEPPTAPPAASCPAPLPQDSVLEVHQAVILPAPDCAPVLRGVSFTLARGEWVLLRGPTGCGKSSLIRGLAGLVPLGGGRLQWGGPLQPHRHGYRGIMVLPQRPLLFTASLRANALFPTSICSQTTAACTPDGAFSPIPAHAMPSCSELRRLLKHLGLWDAVCRGCPSDTDPLDQVADWGARLSPGEAQRLAILRLLLHAPALAVLDEATSAMDEATEGVALGAVRGLGCGVLSVGHRSSLVGWHGRVLEAQQWA